MNTNDLFLILTWVVGIGGAVISAVSARRRVRAQAQLVLDKASFEGANEVIDILKEQLAEMRDELKTMRNEISAMRMREGKLFRRIGVLEYTLRQNNIVIPPEENT